MTEQTWQIIVVEDEYDSLHMVTEILRFYGINVLVAHNGKECIDLLNHNQVTLVLTDLAMPEMDGWETLNAIRANPRTKMIPVAAISAYHSVEVAEQAMNAGFDAFFAKPISPKTFLQSLSKLITH
jgi:CheY-like chemotaxis protein